MIIGILGWNTRLESKYLQISILSKDVKFPVFKVKKFRCKDIPKYID